MFDATIILASKFRCLVDTWTVLFGQADLRSLRGGFNFLAPLLTWSSRVSNRFQAELFVLPCKSLTRLRGLRERGHQVKALIAQPIMSPSITCVAHTGCWSKVCMKCIKRREQWRSKVLAFPAFIYQVPTARR